MYRARLPKRTLLSVSAATTALVSHNSPETREKVVFQFDPTPEIVLLETTSPLEKQIGIVRRKVTQACYNTHSRVQGVVSKWIGVEQAIESRVKSLISPNESLTPGLLYVGISTLTGSIIARNRFLPTRLLLPPAFLIISANHFLPQTTANISSYFASLEETYFPSIAQKHTVANAHARMTWERIKDAAENGRGWVNRGAEAAVENVQGFTGLKLKETLGWTQTTTQQIEKKASEILEAVEERATETNVAFNVKTDGAKENGDKVVETERLV